VEKTNSFHGKTHPGKNSFCRQWQKLVFFNQLAKKSVTVIFPAENQVRYILQEFFF